MQLPRLRLTVGHVVRAFSQRLIRQRRRLHARYCCECSAWEDLALEGWEDDEERESMFTSAKADTWKPVETPTGTVQVAEMKVVTAEYTSSWMEPPP